MKLSVTTISYLCKLNPQTMNQHKPHLSSIASLKLFLVRYFVKARRAVSSVADVRFSHAVDVVYPSVVGFEVPLRFLLLTIEIVLIFILKLPFLSCMIFFLLSHFPSKTEIFFAVSSILYFSCLVLILRCIDYSF